MAKAVAFSLVSSRLYYANSDFGTTQKNISRVQRVQNTLASVVAGHAVPRGTHSSTILQHLHWLPVNQRINFKFAITLSIPLSLLTSALFLATTSRHVLYAPPTPICCRFLRSTQPLLPTVSALLPPQYGTHSLLAFMLVSYHTHSAVCLIPHCFDQAFSSP